MGKKSFNENEETRYTDLIVVTLFTVFSGVGVAVLKDYVYAVGGSDGGKPWDSVERYNPATDTWTR